MLDQEAYIGTVLNRFNMNDAKPATTPMNSGEKLTKEPTPKPEDAEQLKKIPYQEAVGSLMYLAQCTRPDILFAVNKLSRFNTNPSLKHWEAVKHLLRYLKGTAKYKLRYTRQGESKLIGYSDADWAADLDDRKLTSGYIFLLQSGAVS
ncbi:uncharacterized protein LOC129742249 [Uranotaenia lowii]|uniref:uncharacterized protein LOC129742249 n=1 Tax=Uranotaenia lowii TaxID=190385 RepID=UPI002479407F|nr:uncharacterized protein LOC129742249 [Uranotaenia lowii]